MTTDQQNIQDTSTADFLKSILDSALMGIMTFKAERDASGDIVDFKWTYSNEVGAEMVNATGEKLIGNKLLELMPSNRDLGLFDKYREVVESGNLATVEQFFPDDNINKWLRISAVKLGDGFMVTFQDISSLKHAILESEKDKKKYQMLFDESLDAIFVLNDSFQFIDANPCFLKMFHYQWEDVVCKQIQDLFENQDDQNDFQKTLVSSGRVEEMEVDLEDSRQDSKPGLINCVTIYDQESETNFYLGVIRDMTRRKQAEKQLLVAEKLSMTGKLARTIGHEIRNPLTNLSLALEQLKDEVTDSQADTDVYFNIIERNAERIGTLISDLLSSSKPKELQLKSASINQVIEDSLDLIEDRLNLQKMYLKTSLDQDLPAIDLDEDHLRIALVNLYINAIEAMKAEKGVLEVSSALTESNEIRVTIADNGKGIPPENLENLFEPFFTAKKEGTGLGLTTVQNIIVGHGGHIEVTSTLAKGTQFDLHFPV